MGKALNKDESDPWVIVLDLQIAHVELIAEWAATVGYCQIRDKLKSAAYDLKKARESHISIWGDRYD